VDRHDKLALRAYKSRTKKSGFFRNRFPKPTLARGSWPPESPAKSYLKVFLNCQVATDVAERLRLLQVKLAEISPFVNPLDTIQFGR